MPPAPIAVSYRRLVKRLGHETAAVILALVFVDVTPGQRAARLEAIADMLETAIS